MYCRFCLNASEVSIYPMKTLSIAKIYSGIFMFSVVWKEKFICHCVFLGGFFPSFFDSICSFQGV